MWKNVESSSSSADNSVDQIGSIVSSSYEHSTEERDFETMPSALNGGLNEIEKDHGDALPFNKSPSELESSKHVSKDSSKTEWSDGLPSFPTNPESSMLKDESLVDLKELSVEEVNDGATGFMSKDVKPPPLAGHNVMNIILVAAEFAPWSKTVALFNGATADTYTVGDDLEWTIPPAGSIAYTTWANTKRFQNNDTIVFKWSGSHTVAEVSKADYDNCSNSNHLAFYDSSPASITLTSNVTRYFICTVGNHCSDLGQKVTIKISEDDDRWWDRNASSSLTVNIGALILSTAMAIFFYSFN
ncbi:hypothetical protein ACFX13_017903 [Malus domestica]